MRVPRTISPARPVASAAGFTLVESVMAIGLASIMFIALHACFAAGFSMVGVTREDLRATQIIIQRMERVRLCTFDQLKNSSLNPPSTIEYYDPANQGKGQGGVAYTVTFASSIPPAGSLAEAYRTNMLLINVGASWNSGNIKRSRSMQTYVSKDGMQAYVSDGQ